MPDNPFRPKGAPDAALYNWSEHGLWCKHCNFETSLHSPLIVRAPAGPRVSRRESGWRGIKAGARTNALTEYLDIYPSLCELCELPLAGHLQGKSFVPLLKNPNLPWKKAVFSRYFRGDSVKTDRYRYTEWHRKNGTRYARMLYDHKTDPHENVNISELPQNKEVVEKLSKMLEKVRLRQGCCYSSDFNTTSFNWWFFTRSDID